MSKITKIKLKNFKRFRSFQVNFEGNLNIIVGENESGKSSILAAIDLALRGSRSRVESIGIDKLLNMHSVKEFFRDKDYKNLPTAYVELYLSEQSNYELNGRNNSDDHICDGLKMELHPNEELSSEIGKIISDEDNIFPYEYYEVSFSTFSGQSYSGYKKFIRHIVLDNSQVSIDYATREYVSEMYYANVREGEHIRHEFQYRMAKERFDETEFVELNNRIKEYRFALKSDKNSNILADLTLTEDDISIEHKGQGKQSFIKTAFALRKTENFERKIDLVLMEEPENHLSHLNMSKLIQNVQSVDDKQLFIATHNTLIATRLDLRNVIMVHPHSNTPVLLSNLHKSTAKFFIKAPQSSVLEFTLSEKVILVEGPSEYMLMEKMFLVVTNTSLAKSDIHVISVGGISFTRYLEIAQILKIKVAVIRDNDGKYKEISDKFLKKFDSEILKLFCDKDNDRYTFEVCVYRDNEDLCEEIFSGANTKDKLQYMLNNKTEAAYRLLDSDSSDICNVPEYISEAIKWISE